MTIGGEPVQTSVVLRTARQLIEREANWTARAYARNMVGKDVSITSSSACCFCLEGALRRAVWQHCGITVPFGWSQLYDAMHKLAKMRGFPTAVSANDRGGHKIALMLIDDALAELEGA